MNFKILVLLSLAVAATTATDDLFLGELDRFLQTSGGTSNTATCTADTSCSSGCCASWNRKASTATTWTENFKTCTPFRFGRNNATWTNATYSFYVYCINSTNATATVATLGNSDCSANSDCATGQCCMSTTFNVSNSNQTAFSQSLQSTCQTGVASTAYGVTYWTYKLGSTSSYWSGDLQLNATCMDDPATSGVYFKSTLAIFGTLIAFFFF